MHLRMIALLLVIVSNAAFAHGGKPHDAQPEMKQTAFGRTGDAGKVSRTVAIDMSDGMRFTPSELTIRRGETVRFVATNSGKLMHEMVLGTMKGLKEHSELMRKFPGMEHDEPYMAHVPPGKSVAIVWQFTRAGEFNFGCLEPGHFEAGMVGKVKVTQ